MATVIAVPFRADGGGRAHGLDLSLVEGGVLPLRGEEATYLWNRARRGANRHESRVQAKTLISRNLFNALRRMREWPSGYREWDRFVDSPEVLTRLTHDVDALFVPGGPAAHPTQKGDSSHRRTATKRSEKARHILESEAICDCFRRNIPVLAVCGGSWRLAAALGAEIAVLGGTSRSTHNAPFNAGGLQKARHTVVVEAETHLAATLQVQYMGYHRPARYAGKDSAPGVEIPVNSAHWAQSVLPSARGAAGGAAVQGPTSNLRQSARAGGPARGEEVLEGFEAEGSHYCIGVQWHPEFAQVQLLASGGDARDVHARLMESFRLAAKLHRTVVMLQSAVRGRLARRAFEEKKRADSAGGGGGCRGYVEAHVG